MVKENKILNNSIANAFSVLEHFNHHQPEWGVRELAIELGVNKSTLYRTLATLETIGILRKNPENDKYSLGLKLFDLGNRVDVNQSFIRHTHPILKKVADEITETVHLGILKEGNVFMVDKIESPFGLKLNSSIGSSSPIHCTGIGKVLLAHSTSTFIDSVLIGNLEKLTPFTICNKQRLKKELKTVKKQGFALDRQELELGLICVAVPVFNNNNEVVASLSAAGPAIRFKEESLENYVSILKNGATAIQHKIGNFKP